MKKNKNLKWRLLYKLHRYLGLISALVLIMLSVTGIALNHTDDLKLDRQMIQSSPILDWYGIKAEDNFTAYSTKQHWLTKLNQHLYFDQSLLLKNDQQLVGAIEMQEFIVVGLNDTLLLLSLQGELIEQLPITKLKQIGINPQQSTQIVIRTKQEVLYSDDDLMSWQTHTEHNTLWSKPEQLPTTISQQIKKDYRSGILPLERVILDLHSGRLFGSIGVFIVDLSGLFLIILALSGCAVWLKHKLRHLQMMFKNN